MSKAYLAFDLGAESGRAMLATLDGHTVQLHEVHRFANRPAHLPSGLHWDLTGLMNHLVDGLTRGVAEAAKLGVELVSIGVDTWGVDAGLLDANDQLLGLPFCYRDPRHPPAAARVQEQLGDDAIYAATGIQSLPFNTLYQLAALQGEGTGGPARLEQAGSLLLMPDLLHWFLSGERVNELTIASTSQMLDARTGTWATPLLERLGLPTQMLGQPVAAGTRIGTLRPELSEAADCGELAVVVPGSHDTASAVAAIPVDASSGTSGGGWAYLSSGTWSLLGAELDEPVVSEAARTAGFTNELGVGGKVRFLKNISGLWLVQQVRADLAKRGDDFDYPALTALAEAAEPLAVLIDPDHPPFAEPGGMLDKIDTHCRDTGQTPPTTPGSYVRACLEALALSYRRTLTDLEQLTDRTIDRLHLVGGGGKNQLLNQMTADAIGRPVLVGPHEGTAMGNALTQAIGMGDLADLPALRAVVRQSVDVQTVEPGEGTGDWDAAAKRSG
jgi:rhamnulokinase